VVPSRGLKLEGHTPRRCALPSARWRSRLGLISYRRRRSISYRRRTSLSWGTTARMCKLHGRVWNGSVAVRCLFRWGGGAALGRRKQRFKGVAVGSVRLKKQRGIFDNVGLMRVLRFLSSKLDRILSRLFSKPIRRRERACFSPKPIRRSKDIALLPWWILKWAWAYPV
jgi:hypothetical protein